MSEDDRAAFDEGWTKAWEQHTELWNSETEKAIAGAEEGGATFEEVDSEAFVDALTPLLDEFITTDSQQELYDDIRASAE